MGILCLLVFLWSIGDERDGMAWHVVVMMAATMKLDVRRTELARKPLSGVRYMATACKMQAGARRPRYYASGGMGN